MSEAFDRLVGRLLFIIFSMMPLCDFTVLVEVKFTELQFYVIY